MKISMPVIFTVEIADGAGLDGLCLGLEADQVEVYDCSTKENVAGHVTGYGTTAVEVAEV